MRLALTAELPPGFVFASRYRIEKPLGAGAMGAVYRAWDQELNASIALKVIRPDVIGSPATVEGFEQRFRQELLMARQVTHRNVTRIHDLGNADGVRYITMQFVDGTSLAAIILGGPLPFTRVQHFAKQLVAGITAAHDVGVIHRDLKPENVLVNALDNLYISDFGLAKSLEAATMVPITMPGELIGTPLYMSPEQINGAPADHRSDLYAVGLILFEMATGERPLEANSAIELMYQRVQQPAKDVALLNRNVPEYFRHVVMRCLEREPNNRYVNGHQILADLESEHSAPVASKRTVSLTVPLPATHRSKLAVSLVAFTSLAIAVPTVRWLMPANEERTPTAQFTVQKRIAVLPFKIIGDQTTTLAPFAAGIEDALSTKLFQLPGVTVAAAAAVERAAAKESLAAIAKDLGTPLLISGTLRGDSNGLRVTLNLEDVEAGRRLLSQDFSGLAADMLTLEDQMYSRLIASMGVKPSSDALARGLMHPTENIEAYQLYLRGRNAMRGQQDDQNVKASIGFYEQALKLDPAFARAYAGISDSALRLYRTTKDQSWVEKALAAAQQGQRLDEKLLEVRLALGSVYQATGRTAEAIAELTVASEMAPSSDDVFRRLGRAYLSAGRGDDAVRAYERAVAVNPYYWVSYGALGNAQMQLGQYEAAATVLKKVIELEPSNVSGHNDLGATFLQMGRYDEAAMAFARALEIQPIAQTYTNLGIANAYAGRHAEAIAAFERAVELNPKADQFIGNLGDGYRWGGHKDKAAAAYDKAIALAVQDLQINPRNAMARGSIALYYAKKGDDAQARRMIVNARAIDNANVNLAYFEATIHSLAGRTQDALALLEEALEAGYPVAAMQSDPDIQRLSTDARFQTIIEKFRPTSGGKR
jgi:serine/threonine-protein kinase